MYGKSKNLGLFLGAVFAIALVTSLIVPFKQPPVGGITYNTVSTYADSFLDRHRSDSNLYVLLSCFTPFFTQE